MSNALKQYKMQGLDVTVLSTKWLVWVEPIKSPLQNDVDSKTGCHFVETKNELSTKCSIMLYSGLEAHHFVEKILTGIQT